MSVKNDSPENLLLRTEYGFRFMLAISGDVIDDSFVINWSIFVESKLIPLFSLFTSSKVSAFSEMRNGKPYDK
jgi:hypothetical protein